MAARLIYCAAALALATGCTTADVLLPETVAAPSGRPAEESGSALDRLIARYAAFYEVPVELVRRVVKRESNFRPGARNGPYWGLMQIRHDTAQGMGYRGSASGLLDAETNLKYAVKYLRGAYITASGNQDQAVRFYARGYYYDAKRKGLLVEAGLRPGPKKAEPATAVAAAAPVEAANPAAVAEAQPAQAASPETSMSFAGGTPSGPAPIPSFAPPSR